MSLGLILIILLIIYLLGGFSGRFGGYGYGMGHSGMGLGGLDSGGAASCCCCSASYNPAHNSLKLQVYFGPAGCMRGFIICCRRSRISVKRAYIRAVLK